jgi:hypothetical protein
MTLSYYDLGASRPVGTQPWTGWPFSVPPGYIAGLAAVLVVGAVAAGLPPALGVTLPAAGFSVGSVPAVNGLSPVAGIRLTPGGGIGGLSLRVGVWLSGGGVAVEGLPLRAGEVLPICELVAGLCSFRGVSGSVADFPFDWPPAV